MKAILLSLLSVVTLLIIGGYFYMNNNKQTNMDNNSVTSFGHFQSDALLDVAFDYPEFPGWQVEVKDLMIRYIPGPEIPTKFEYPPSVVINIVNFGMYSEEGTKKNPHGVRYWDDGYNKELGMPKITFLHRGAGIDLSVPRDQEYENFSGKLIWETVIDSFKFQ